MASARRALVAVGSLLILANPARLEAQEQAEASPSFIVGLDDRAGVDQATLRRACAMVALAYASADVVLRWRRCPGGTEPPGAPLIVLAVTPVAIAHAQTAARGVLGIAAESDVGIGRMAYVFYDRIKAFARRRGHDEAATLALVMAHEIGHLLLPPASPDRAGVMKPRWSFADVVGVTQGKLRFSPGQAAAIRHRLRASAESRVNALSLREPEAVDPD